MFQEGFSRRGFGRVIVPPPIVRGIEIEEPFRPVKAGDQIIVLSVFDNFPKPNAGLKFICESFPGVVSEDPLGFCSSESP